MENRTLSILIPARCEEFLGQTIQNILENIEANTEIIVVLDGKWPTTAIPDNDRVTLVYLPEAIGQRKAINLACKLSRAKYMMKLDAHCAMSKGFDRIMIEDMQDDWTMVPKMYNLHAFNWKCKKCGNQWYQGPTPRHCQTNLGRHKSEINNQCDGTDFERIMTWERNTSPETTSMLFNPAELKFGYWGGYKLKQVGDLVETMTLLGACWMLTREKYWELNICDENHGSWGQQGTEVACKTWLSGGGLICNKKCWFAHMFRTQGGDFGFPYPNGGVSSARKYSKDLWMNNRFEKQIHPLHWLIEKFWPIEGWKEEDLNAVREAGKSFGVKIESVPKKKGIIFYTDNQLNLRIAHRVQKQLKNIGLPIVSSSLKPMPHFGDNIYLPLKRGYLTMFRQILAALEKSDFDIVYLCEHDVFYPKEHFEFTPSKRDTIYYDINVYKLRDDGVALWVNNCRQVSGICAFRDSLIKHYKERVDYVTKNGYDRNMGFEPATHGRVQWEYKMTSESWMSSVPMIDIRHDGNLTPNRWSKDKFRNQKNTEGWKFVDEISGYGKLKDFFSDILKK